MAMSASADHANPASPEVRVKPPTAAIHTRLGPKRSAAHPVSGMTVASASR
jgi:hypothetical protein